MLLAALLTVFNYLNVLHQSSGWAECLHDPQACLTNMMFIFFRAPKPLLGPNTVSEKGWDGKGAGGSVCFEYFRI